MCHAVQSTMWLLNVLFFSFVLDPRKLTLSHHPATPLPLWPCQLDMQLTLHHCIHVAVHWSLVRSAAFPLCNNGHCSFHFEQNPTSKKTHLGQKPILWKCPDKWNQCASLFECLKHQTGVCLLAVWCQTNRQTSLKTHVFEVSAKDRIFLSLFWLIWFFLMP